MLTDLRLSRAMAAADAASPILLAADALKAIVTAALNAADQHDQGSPLDALATSGQRNSDTSGWGS